MQVLQRGPARRVLARGNLPASVHRILRSLLLKTVESDAFKGKCRAFAVRLNSAGALVIILTGGHRT